jgi:hypothetical protein
MACVARSRAAPGAQQSCRARLVLRLQQPHTPGCTRGLAVSAAWARCRATGPVRARLLCASARTDSWGCSSGVLRGELAQLPRVQLLEQLP